MRQAGEKTSLIFFQINQHKTQTISSIQLPIHHGKIYLIMEKQLFYMIILENVVVNK
jgi:hypothetical protein